MRKRWTSQKGKWARTQERQFLFFSCKKNCWSLQSCPTLCDPIDGSPPGSPIPGILQARTLEWIAISSSNAWKWKVKVKLLSRVRLCATPWTAAYQAPPSTRFASQEYWSGLPLPSLLSSPTRNQTHILCIGRRNLNHWTNREVPSPVLWTWFPLVLWTYLK